MFYRRNADVDLQRLRREWQAGDLEAGVHYLETKLRRDEIGYPQISLAAGLLDEASLVVIKKEYPSYYRHIIDNAHMKVPATRKQFIDPATGFGKHGYIAANFSLRALIGAVDAISDRLPEEVRNLPDEARAWLKLSSPDHEKPGQEIAERYLDFFEALPQVSMRRQRDSNGFLKEQLEHPKDRVCAAAFHLTHAISMSSACNWRTRWKWGFASDRMVDGVSAAIQSCVVGFFEEGPDKRDECLDQIAGKIRAETLPWLLF